LCEGCATESKRQGGTGGSTVPNDLQHKQCASLYNILISLLKYRGNPISG